MVKETKGNKPVYDLAQAKALVSGGHFSMTRRVTKFIHDIWDDRPRMAAVEIFGSLSSEGFHKAVELGYLPGTFADVYYTNYGGESWYVKFYIEEGKPIVQLLSCNIDGYVH